jgi:3-oxoacyl-[acyl-carrier protein] reductase
MSRRKNKVAVVTGASKGIGASIARGLAAEGAAVVVNYANEPEGAERVVSEITANGGKAVAVQGNVSSAPDVRRLFAETKRLKHHQHWLDCQPLDTSVEHSLLRDQGRSTR